MNPPTIKRSKFGNDFLKDRNDASQSAYRKQRNFCLNFLQKAKKTVFLEFRTKTYNR